MEIFNVYINVVYLFDLLFSWILHAVMESHNVYKKGIFTVEAPPDTPTYNLHHLIKHRNFHAISFPGSVFLESDVSQNTNYTILSLFIKMNTHCYFGPIY